MITIYKNKNDIPDNMELILFNDAFFNKVTVDKLDKRAEAVIGKIDGAKYIGKYQIKSRFHDVVVDIDKLSTGCKTILNVMYNGDKVFLMSECGENALDVIYKLEKGFVYCSFPTISFNMDKVKVVSDGTEKEIDDYEELKEWWNNEE